MNIKELKNNYVKLTSANGILDIRDNRVYSEVVCKPENVKYYKDNVIETTETEEVTTEE
jgi:hypothetical protein